MVFVESPNRHANHVLFNVIVPLDGSAIARELFDLFRRHQCQNVINVFIFKLVTTIDETLHDFKCVAYFLLNSPEHLHLFRLFGRTDAGKLGKESSRPKWIIVVDFLFHLEGPFVGDELNIYRELVPVESEKFQGIDDTVFVSHHGDRVLNTATTIVNLNVVFTSEFVAMGRRGYDAIRHDVNRNQVELALA